MEQPTEREPSKIREFFGDTSFEDIQLMRHKFEGKKNVKVFPNPSARATFDPLIGFPNGRKERVMVASLKEMEDANVPLEKRDYCAHIYINWKKCFMENSPWGKRKCKHEAHEYSECQREDFILRKMEYERERRLGEREKRKQKTQLIEGQIM